MHLHFAIGSFTWSGSTSILPLILLSADISARGFLVIWALPRSAANSRYRESARIRRVLSDINDDRYDPDDNHANEIAFPVISSEQCREEEALHDHRGDHGDETGKGHRQDVAVLDMRKFVGKYGFEFVPGEEAHD